MSEDTPTESGQLIDDAVAAAVSSLASSGDWLTGPERLAAWSESRDARTNPIDLARRDAISPNAVGAAHTASEQLPSEAIEVVHRIASDPGRLTQSWADEMMETLGEETYVELVGLAAIAATIDMFDWALNGSERRLPTPSSGTPQRLRPDDVDDVGAWVAQSTSPTAANVSRSLSLVPVTNGAWFGLVQSMYSRGAEFLDLAWSRALSRPQVELVAARTTAELECFY